MSKTYRKTLRFGICTGSNTEYYEMRRRNHRKQLADELRKAVKNCEDGQIDERLLPVKFIKKDSWDEPTDGTWTMKRSDYERDLRQYGPDEYNAEWWWRKEVHKLKSKNQHANFRKYRKTKNNL